MKTRKEIESFLENIQFISPNEPITPQGIQRVLDQMNEATQDLEDFLGVGGKTITMWNPNLQYNKDDMVMYFKQENKQKAPEVGKREFVFILVSRKDQNDSIPNYDVIDGIPDFTKSNWTLLNPMSYLLQDLIEMKNVVVEVFQKVLEQHVEEEHGLIGSVDIENNLVKKDFSNLTTPWRKGKYSLVKKMVESQNGWVKKRISSNGIMEYQIKYSFDEKANQYLYINDRKYYYQKSPIWDESDQTIFSQKYTEDNMFSVNVHERKEQNEDGTEQVKFTSFNNLRYGTNIFNKHIEFPTTFYNNEYMVFFDTYGAGTFVFGYDKNDIQEQTEPTYDAVVSMPMMLNKTRAGFDIVLPIHTYFNSIQKWNIGVPWDNVFTLQVIGRYK